MTPPEQSQPEAGMELDLSGRQLGDFRLLRRLGRGAMADVYLAEQCSLRRQVAFKVLKRELAGDETYVRRFHQEAQAAASLVHANIVQIYEVGCLDGLHFIAQEYVPGVNLRELMVRRGPPDLRLALLIMRQVAAALAKAADHGIVHRDIKPDNIMLAQSGEVKVADFGLARVCGNGDALNLTQVGMTMGTPLYMSPEQVEGKPLDPRSDIYSFGITCYHMLTGQPPFRGDTAISVALAHVQTQPERLENHRPDLPGGMCRIVHTMLAKLPEQRYQGARELLKDLRGLHVESGADDSPLELDEWNAAELTTPELTAAGDTTLGATGRLAAAMRTQALATRGNRRWLGWSAAATVAAAMAGGLAAYTLREPFLLEAPAGAVEVDRKDSAEAQYLHAMFVGTEAAWTSVGSYFPDNRKYAALARQQLARFYLHELDYDRAMHIFAEFSEETDPAGRAFGLAGEAIVLSLTNQTRESSGKLAELHDLAKGLSPQQLERLGLDRQMIRLVGIAAGRTERGTDQAHAAAWDTWIKQNFAEEPPPLEPVDSGPLDR